MDTPTLLLLAVAGLAPQDPQPAGEVGGPEDARVLLVGLEPLGRACRFDYREHELAWFCEAEPTPEEQAWIDSIRGWLDLGAGGEELVFDELLAHFEASWQQGVDGGLRCERAERQYHVVADGAGGLLQSDTARELPEAWLLAPDLALNYDARHGRIMARDPPIGVRVWDVDTILGPAFASPPRLAEMGDMDWRVESAERTGGARPLLVLTQHSPQQAPEEPPAGLWRIELERPGGLPVSALRQVGAGARTLALYRHAPNESGERWLAEVLFITWFEGSEVSLARRRLSRVSSDVQPADLCLVVPEGTVLQDQRALGGPRDCGPDAAHWPARIRRVVEFAGPIAVRAEDPSPAERGEER